MKYIGDSTPAWSFSKKPKAGLDDYRTETTNCDIPDLSEGVKKFRSTQVSWTIPKSVQPRTPSAANSKSYMVPPVGAYNITNEMGQGKRSSTANSANFQGASSRNSMYRTEATPGVGRYNLRRRVFSSSLGFSFGSKVDDAWRKPQTPGPADYTSVAHTISHRSAVSAHHGGLKPRPDSRQQQDEEIKHEVQTDVDTNATQTGSVFRKHKSSDPVSEEGRKLYLLPDSMEALRKTSSKIGTFSRSKSIGNDDNEAKQTPGPGFYNPHTDYIRLGMQKGKGYSLTSKSVDHKDKTPPVPGPGMYPLPSSISNTGWSLSKAKRLLNAILGESSRNPGPGTYNPVPVVMARTASLTQDPREKQPTKAYIPGPGTYNLRKNPGANTPTFSFRARTKFNSPFPAEVEKNYAMLEKEGYIPKDYSPDYKAVLPQERKITFAKSSRPDLGRNPTTGPGIGAYDVPRDGVEYHTGCTFGSAKRTQEFKEDDIFPLPGPGSYTLKPTVPQLQIYEQQKLEILQERASLFGRKPTEKDKEFVKVKEQLQGVTGGNKINPGARILRPNRKA